MDLRTLQSLSVPTMVADTAASSHVDANEGATAVSGKIYKPLSFYSRWKPLLMSFGNTIFTDRLFSIVLRQIGVDASVRGLQRNKFPEKFITAVFSIQKLADLIRGGGDSEILLALGKLPQVMEHCFDDTCAILVPTICEEVVTWPPELQIRAGQELLALEKHCIGKELGRVMTFTSLLIIRETSLVTSTNAGKLYELFGRLAGVSIPAVKWNVDDLAPVLLFVEECSVSAFSEERCAAVAFCLGLCKSESLVSSLNVPQQGASRLWSLASDPSLDVLAKCLEVFGECATSFTDQDASDTIWPLIEKVWAQESGDVISPHGLLARASAVKCAAQIFEARFGQDEEYPTQARPGKDKSMEVLLQRVLDFAQMWCRKDQLGLDDAVYVTEVAVAEHLVRLIYYASQGVPTSRRYFSMKTAIRVYSELVQSNGPDIRKKCAYNMPAMANLTSRDKEATGILTICCEELTLDTEDSVRDALAKGFHETVKCLTSKKNVAKLKGTLINLVQDDCNVVRSSIFGNLSESLVAIANDVKGFVSEDIIDVMQKAYSALTKRDWRLSREFALQAGNICEAFPTLGLEDSMLSMLFDLVNSTQSLEVRTVTAKAIVTLTRAIPHPEARDKHIAKLIGSLVGGTHQKRIVAVECALHALEVYSEVLFSKLFASSALLLAHDEVPNVRIRVAKALPQLAPGCRGHAMFEPALTRLRSDPDVDVRRAMCGYVMLASKFISRSRDSKDAEYNRRAAEIRHYSAGSRSTPRSGGGGGPVLHHTPTSISSFAAVVGAPLLHAVKLPGRLGKRVAAIALLRGSTMDSSHEDLARQFSDSQTMGVESARSVSRDHQLSALSSLCDSRSGDASVFLGDSEVPPMPETSSEKQLTPSNTRCLTRKSIPDVSLVLSGPISSSGKPTGADISETSAGQTSTAPSTSPTKLNRNACLEKQPSQISMLRNESSKLYMNAPALPAQAVTEKFRSRHTGAIRLCYNEPRLNATFSNDSIFSTAMSDEFASNSDRSSPTYALSKHRAGPESSSLSSDEQEESIATVQAPRSFGSRMADSFASGLRALVRRRSRVLARFGSRRRRGSSSERDVVINEKQDSSGEPEIGPDECSPQYDDPDPPADATAHGNRVTAATREAAQEHRGG